MGNQFVHENPRLIHTAQIICTLRNINIHKNLRPRVGICTGIPQVARLLHEEEKACSRNIIWLYNAIIGYQFHAAKK